MSSYTYNRVSSCQEEEEEDDDRFVERDPGCYTMRNESQDLELEVTHTRLVTTYSDMDGPSSPCKVSTRERLSTQPKLQASDSVQF